MARELIERVTLIPLPEGAFEIELEGAIAAMVRLGLGTDAHSRRRGSGAGHDLFFGSVKVVAGTRNQHDLLLLG